MPLSAARAAAGAAEAAEEAGVDAAMEVAVIDAALNVILHGSTGLSSDTGSRCRVRKSPVCRRIRAWDICYREK